jgi:hypothetical protein
MTPPQRDAKVVDKINSTLGLYALVALIIEAGLITAVVMTAGTDRTLLISGLLFVLLTVVVVAGVKYQRSTEQSHIVSIDPLWDEEHIPVTTDQRDLWIGEWRFRWTYKDKDKNLRPYIDDVILITEIDCRTGFLEGKGRTAYEGPDYLVKGRISRKGVAHILWISPPPRFGMAGMVILSYGSEGILSGWWLGTSRDFREIGGHVTWERSRGNTGVEINRYEVENL